MLRRSVVSLAGSVTLSAAFTPFASLGQQQSKVLKIGWLTLGSAESNKLLTDTFVDALRKLGYVEGKNLAIDLRFADGNVGRLPTLAAGLVQQDPNVLYAANGAASAALKNATSTIPIVFATVGDPVGLGLVENLSKPGGNATGVSTLAIDLIAKRVQLVKEAFPERLRVAVFVGPDTIRSLVVELQRGAKLLGLELLIIEPQQPDDIGRASTQLREWRAGAIFVVDSGFNLRHRHLLFNLAARMRLPAMYPGNQYVEDGGLICYGADLASQVRSAAVYVHKILNGVKPADLPVRQAAEFDLVVNMQTAKALGIGFPQSVLLRATRVIE